MQKNNWLRLSLGAIILAGVGAGSVLQGCSDDAVTPVDAGKDTSPTATTTTTSTGTTTGTNTADTAPPPPPPKSQKIIFVHAANWLGAAFESTPGADGGLSPINGAIRLCLRSGPAASPDGTNPFLPVPALPNVAAAPLPIPALLPGTGGVLPASTDFSTVKLEGYAMNAQRLAQKGIVNQSCADLFSKGYGEDGGVGPAVDAGTPLVEGIDYVNVGVIPAGTFGTEKTFLVTAQGCSKGYADVAAAGVVAAKCGATYSNTTGNLKLKFQEVSRAAVGGTELGAQFVHATTATATLSPINAGIMTIGGDAAAFKPFATAATAYDAPITAQVKLAGVNLTTDGISINPALPVPPYSFASAIAATQAKTPVELGKPYLYVLVGEAAALQDDTMPANRKLHFLAFPSDPVVPQLTQ